MAGQLELSSLDFAKNKQEFIKYLRTRPEFSDANFDGSNINYLLDAFAYNSTFFGYLANSTYNETTLDTVAQRKNALSIAHDLAYDVDRAIPATATVTVTLVDRQRVLNKIPSFDFTLNTLVLPRFTQFRSADGLTFITEQDYVLSPDNGFTNTFPVREGNIIQNQAIGTSTGAANQVLRINVDNIADILTELRVDGVVWDNIQDITVYDSTTHYYQIQENFRETYDFKFGDGRLGIIPPTNSALTLTYMITSGVDGNFQNGFTLIGSAYNDGHINPADEIDNTVFSTATIVNSNGGRDKESIETIRRSAPRWYAAQSRAITHSDYETILRKHQFVEYINVYGGETLNPPVYGFVYATIKPPGADALTPEQEDSITAFIDQFNIESIRLRVRSPLFINVRVTVSANFNLRTASQGSILSAIRGTLQEYFVSQNENGEGFYYSGALCDIDELPGVTSANMTIATYTDITPSVDGVYYLNLGQELTPGSIDLTFNTTSGWRDDGGDIIDKDNGLVIGSVNYKTGVISIVDYTKLIAETELYFTFASGNAELFQNVLIRYDEANSTFTAKGIFR
jgi:hypothetical protein